MDIDQRITEFIDVHFSENKEFHDTLMKEMETFDCNYHLSKFKNGALGFVMDDKNVYLSEALIDESRYDRFFLIFILFHETKHTSQEKDFDVDGLETFAKDIQDCEDEANEYAFDMLRKLSEHGYKEEINGIITELSNFLVNLEESSFMEDQIKKYYERGSEYEIDDIIEL